MFKYLNIEKLKISFFFIVFFYLFVQDIKAKEETEFLDSSDARPVGTELVREITPCESGESVAFSGCGFYLAYQIGVASFLQDHYHLEQVRFVGCSGGAFASLMLGLELDFKTVWGDCGPKLYKGLSQKRTGALFNFEDVAKKVFLEYLPKDIYQKANKKVFLPVTFFRGIAPYMEYISEWDSNEDIVASVIASTKIPYFTKPSFFAEYKGRKCLDGSLTRPNLLLDERTIYVGPHQLGGLSKIGAFYPQFTEESNNALIQKGYADAQSQPQYWARLERLRIGLV